MNIVSLLNVELSLAFIAAKIELNFIRVEREREREK